MHPLDASGDTAPTWAVAGGSLALGFAVAEITGVRALGGLVLVAAVLWCLPRWRRTGNAAKLTGAYAAAFALSHALGLLTGAWPAVALASASMSALAYRAENSS